MEQKFNKINVSVINFSPVIDNRKIYKGLNFSIKNGEVLAIMGKSGVGKTLLLDAISNTWSHTGSKILKENYFKVFQNDMQFFPWMSIENNLKLACGKQKLKEIFSLWGIEEYKNKLPHQLSVGQRQRVTLARALYREENILLCDEPLSAVDSLTRLLIIKDLKKTLSKIKKTILWVTHDVLEAKHIANQILIINKNNHIKIKPNKHQNEILRAIK